MPIQNGRRPQLVQPQPVTGKPLHINTIIERVGVHRWRLMGADERRRVVEQHRRLAQRTRGKNSRFRKMGIR